MNKLYEILLLALGLFLFSATSIGQESPTQIYLNERDKVAKLFSSSTDEISTKLIDEQIDAEMNGPLQTMIRNVVGTLNIKGFPKEGKYNLSSLYRNDPGSFGLDGVQATSLDGKTQVVVSTVPLLHAWLHSHNDFLSENIKTAFTSELFYQYASNSDSGVFKYTEIPLHTSIRNSMAEAILFAYSMEYVAPSPPDKIGLAVIKDNRVYVFIEDTKIPLEIPVCTTAFDNEIKAAGGQEIKTSEGWGLINVSGETLDPANTRFLKCFAQNFPSQAYYPAVIEQAQALLAKIEN